MFPPPPTEAILFRISASVGFTVDRQSGHVLLDLSHASIHCVIYGSHSTRLYEKEDECARFENYKMVVQLDPKSIETNPETQMSPRPIALWYNLHFRAKKGWLNDHSRIQYHKKAAMDESNYEGTTIDTVMEHKFEKEVIKSVY